LTNLYEAVEACLSIDLEHIEISENDKVLEPCGLKSISGKAFARLLESRRMETDSSPAAVIMCI